jgi:hypothetical protein
VPPPAGVGSIFYQFIQNAAGVLLPQRLITQYTGASVTVSDDAGNNRTIVDLSGVVAAECLIFGAQRTLTAAGPHYLFPGYAQADPRNSNTAQMIAPRAGTLRNLFVLHNVVGVGAGSIQYRLLLNGAPTLLLVSLLATAASGSNLVNTVAVAQGDLLSLEMTKTPPIGTGPQRPVVTMEFA